MQIRGHNWMPFNNMDITVIKRVLRLYFIQQLAEDESIRSENMLNPNFNHIPSSEGPVALLSYIKNPSAVQLIRLKTLISLLIPKSLMI